MEVANWRTSAEKIELCEEAGFKRIESAQTLTAHPVYSECAYEDPQPGHDRGDYVAVIAYKD